MEVRDAIRKPPVTIACDDTVAHAAELMDRTAVGCLIVTDHDQPVGVVTDRDIVVRGVARNVAGDARIDALMTTEVIAVEANADLRAVLGVFRSHPIRRLPVMDQGTLVGMLTLDDMIVDLSADLCDLSRAVTGQVIFGHPEPSPLMTS
jgi:CBS domain-containing protein